MTDATPNIHSADFIEELCALKNAALDASYISGRFHRLGTILKFGRVNAGWHSEAGGHSVLTEVGLRLGNTALFDSSPATLHVIDPPSEHVFTTYELNLEGSEAMNVYRQTIAEGIDQTYMAIYRGLRAKAAERRLGISGITQEDGDLLFLEMKRGASGNYSFDSDALND